MRARSGRLLAAATPLVVVGICAGGAGPAAAQFTAVLKPESLDKPAKGFRLTPRDARRIADRLPQVRQEKRKQRLATQLQVPLYFGDRRYEVIYVAHGDVIVDVHVQGRSGRVLEAWTGPQANTLLARGYEPSVGRSLNKPYIWIPLALLFVVPFLDPRRPFRLLHLDLLVLLGFGASQFFFNKGQVDLSVPLVYPPLLYLLVRTLLAGLRPRERSGPLVPLLPAACLAIALVALVAFRITLNAVDSNVMDVGAQSVSGADRIDHGEDLYSVNGVIDDKGDTYGPVTYVAYLPFEAIWPADGKGGPDPAARAAAISFDLAVLIGLLLLGAQLRPGRAGRILGLALAYAWAAYPFSLYTLQSNTNDALVAALLVLTLLALRSTPLRGVMLGLATAAKFAPLALAPLFAGGMGEEPRRRAWPAFAAALVATVGVAVVVYLPDGGLREFWDATLGYQLGRESPFSLWGLHPSLGWLQDVVKVAAAGLAAALAFVPRRRTPRQLAALGAAVLIAVQLTATYWFYFYIVWFAPFALVALLTAYRTGGSIASTPIRREAVAAPGMNRTSTRSALGASTSNRAGVSGSAGELRPRPSSST